ncbi:MAG TPA: DUF4149 domain-containing protein [Tepidisphaeraceae bacterium]|nr:DUF4149 domain-containing protein [Tepidisphaeraceae bacterium]
MLFQLVQILYWLALSTWFGSVLFIAVAAPIIFRTVREANPLLPNVLSVNLQGQHGELMAGTIVGNLLSRLAQIEIVCAAVLLVILIVQPFTIDTRDTNKTAMILRTAMYFVAAALVLVDRFVLWPNIWKSRQEYLDHADEPEVANPAKDRFDEEHRRSVMLMQIVLFLLLGMILFSGNISPSRGEPTTIPNVQSAIEKSP